MTKQIILRGPPSIDRRRPLLDGQDFSSRGSPRPDCSCERTRVAEVVGGTAAECAAICCCCPCGLVNLLVLAVYKLPAGLCRKALRRKRRRRLMKNGVLQPPVKCGYDEAELQIHSVSTPLATANSLDSDKEVVELEKEMWNKFYSAGFWRSPSQRSDHAM